MNSQDVKEIANNSEELIAISSSAWYDESAPSWKAQHPTTRGGGISRRLNSTGEWYHG